MSCTNAHVYFLVLTVWPPRQWVACYFFCASPSTFLCHKLVEQLLPHFCLSDIFTSPCYVQQFNNSNVNGSIQQQHIYIVWAYIFLSLSVSSLSVVNSNFSFPWWLGIVKYMTSTLSQVSIIAVQLHTSASDKHSITNATWWESFSYRWTCMQILYI